MRPNIDVKFGLEFALKFTASYREQAVLRTDAV